MASCYDTVCHVSVLFNTDGWSSESTLDFPSTAARITSNRGTFGMNDDDLDLNVETIHLADEDGRSLLCSVEKSADIEGTKYLLLLPVHAPIEIFAWEEGDEEDEEVLVDIDDEEVVDVFDTARAVLAEQNLMLTHTAFTLTAEGDLPDPVDDDIITLNIGEDEEANETEQFQMLATFFYEEQEYVLCTPLEPLLFFARANGQQTPELLSPEEFQTVRPQLEDLLFEDID